MSLVGMIEEVEERDRRQRRRKKSWIESGGATFEGAGCCARSHSVVFVVVVVVVEVVEWAFRIGDEMGNEWKMKEG